MRHAPSLSSLMREGWDIHDKNGLRLHVLKPVDYDDPLTSAPSTKCTAGRDFQLVFKQPNNKTTWFTDMPFHTSGVVSMTDFVKVRQG